MTFFQQNNIDIQDYNRIDPKDLKVRKKLQIYQKKQSVLFYVEQKSRILQKDVEPYEAILQKLEDHSKEIITDKKIAINAPLCSKAKAKFELSGWEVVG